MSVAAKREYLDAADQRDSSAPTFRGAIRRCAGRGDDNDRGRIVLQKCAAIYSLMEKRAREGHLPVTRQALESALLLLTRGVGPGYYQMAGFWERGLSWQDKTGQLSAREYRRVVQNFNPEHYRKLSQNKIAEKAILTLFGLPTPRFLGRLSAHVGMDARGTPLRGAADLIRVLDAQTPHGVVFKELEGHGGKGVRIVQLQRDERGWLVRPLCDDISIRLEEYVRGALQLDDGGDWLVEEYMHQHEVTAALNRSSVNTVRMWVRRDSGPGCVLLAYLRIGRSGMCVDNASSGGIVAPIDLRTGVLEAARDATATRALYTEHPDTGAAIRGVQLPCWEEVCALGIRVLGAFPALRFAGMDLAIGHSGPMIIEMNVSPDREGAAFTRYRSVELAVSAAPRRLPASRHPPS